MCVCVCVQFRKILHCILYHMNLIGATVSSQYSVAESDTPLPVTIMLSNRASEDVVVEVTLSDGSANGNVQ